MKSFGKRFCTDKDISKQTEVNIFTKGFAVLNGFNLGRFWNVGPQKTLYVPRSVLRQGGNELIVFDSDGVQGSPMVEFTDKPDLG